MYFLGVRRRKADQIADDLLGRIVSGELPVGSLLPVEAELAARYEVNRSVVREAIKKLEVHRLVQPVRRKGTVVLDPIASLSPEVLRALLSPGRRRIDRAFLGHLLEFRAHLDHQMTALAALRRTEEDLAQLHELVARLEANLGNPTAYADAIEGVGMIIARASGNPIYEMIIHWQRHITCELEDLFRVARFPADGHLEGYRQLVEAIERRDVAAVAELVDRFHNWATPRILEALG